MRSPRRCWCILSDYCNLLHARSSWSQACHSWGATSLSQLLFLAVSVETNLSRWALLALREGLESFATYYSNVPSMIRYVRLQAAARKFGMARQYIACKIPGYYRHSLHPPQNKKGIKNRFEIMSYYINDY